MNLLLPAWALIRREFQRFWRERSRVAGFVAPPLLFWIVVGSGFGNMEYFFPGALTMTVMFSAIFSMMSLIEDRREGFLLSVLVSPAHRGAIVLGKVLGASLLAWLQGLVVLACVFFTQLDRSPAALAGAALALLVTALLLTSVSFWFAWRLESTQGFHAIMNLVFVPCWMLSGAIFDPSYSMGWIKSVMAANPLYYAQALVRGFLAPSSRPDLPSAMLSMNVLLGVFAFFFLASAAAVARPARSSRS